MKVQPCLRRYFAAAAVRERDARVKHYPDMVQDGRLTREVADAEISAWRVIAELLAPPLRGEGDQPQAGGGVSVHEKGMTTVETPLSWAELEHATANALLRREEALQAAGFPGDCPGDSSSPAAAELLRRHQDLLARRDAVWGIHARISAARNHPPLRGAGDHAQHGGGVSAHEGKEAA